MLDSLRRLWNKGSNQAELAPIKAWADSRGYECRMVRDGEGCMVEPAGPHPNWRIEWGASQRSYIEGRELRIIGELGTPKDLMALVLTRPLMESMERQVFEEYVEDVQTRIDTATPAEMRWLVMYTKLLGTELGRLRKRYAAVSSVKGWLVQWLGGPLNDALAATLDVANGQDPMVMTVQRGRLTLRTPMASADTAAMVMWLSVFEHALREGRRLNQEWQESADTSHSTQPAAWDKSMLPGDDGV